MRSVIAGIGFMFMCGGIMSGCGGTPRQHPQGQAATENPAALYTALRDRHVAQWQELEGQHALAWWEAALSGADEDFAQAREFEIALRRLHSDRETFETLRRLREEGQITDPTLARSLDVLYFAFEENQIEDELMQQMVGLQSELEQTFNTFRPELEGERITANQIRETLGSSTDSSQRQTMWEASKEVGAQVADGVIRLAHLRNQAAQALGYANYYEWMLRVREQDPQELDRIFNELAATTEEPYRRGKQALDAALVQRFSLASAEELRPWHYSDPFFQESPGAGIDLDPMFADRDPREVNLAFYQGLGLPVVGEILERSDLYEREGKVEHAFCTHIDRRGDVRVLTNLQNDERWTGTLLHELGHGVYDAHIDQSLPFELREPAHIFTTEGVAELFGMLTRDPVWLRRHASIPADAPANLTELVTAEHRLDLLIFARWTLVMVNFERALYTNPDQNLNRLWWELVQRYQGLQPPENVDDRHDFATKIHLVVAPVYYHNYMLGRMYSAQLRHRLSQAVPETMASGAFDMTGQAGVGQYLVDNVFRPGSLYPWADFVTRSTGEPLTARYFAEAAIAPEPPPPPAPAAETEPTESVPQ